MEKNKNTKILETIGTVRERERERERELLNKVDIIGSTKKFNVKCERTNKIIYVDKERIDYVAMRKEDRYGSIVCSFCALFYKQIFNQIEEKDKYA